MQVLTRQKSVPWSWIFLFTSINAIMAFNERCAGPALTFSIRKFTADPAMIAFVGAINIAFNFLVAPYVSWKSDRIWTRWGRRKPFMIVGFALLVVSVAAVPFAPSLWALVGIVILWQFAVDFGFTGPYEPLLYEVTPIPQRGRMLVIRRMLTFPLRLLFNLVLIGQFDNVYQLSVGGRGLSITGAHVIFGLAALLALLTLLKVVFCIREVRPDTVAHTGASFNPLQYFREIFGERQFMLLYLLLICSAFMTAGLGSLGSLVMTEQFGYSKQQLGNIASIMMGVDFFIIMPLAIFIVDRFDRFRIFLVGLTLSTLITIIYWLCIKFVFPNQIPPLHWIIIFDILGLSADLVAGLALSPYYFELVPRSKLGTINSGFLLMRGVLGFGMAFAVGLWVKYYSKLFCPPGVNDYTSGYLYVFLLGVLGMVGAFYFESQRRKGRIVEYGKMEEEAAPAVAAQL